VVQVKKYNESLPIRFDAVAALSMIVEEEKANRGLFITTSRYLQQGKKEG
jgi:restriction endonuclease Mrr